MAEMTAAEAVEMSKHEVSLFMKRRREIAALLEAQQAEIEKLKCCGNCKQLIFGRLCEVHCDERNRADKCDKWEGVSRDD